MIIAIIILLPMIFGFFALIGAATLDEKHAPLKIFLFLLSLISFWVSLHFAMISVVQYYNFPALQNLIGSTTYWSSLVMFGIFSYFVIYLFYKIVQVAAQKKQERLNY